jgi:hypothetical protein
MLPLHSTDVLYPSWTAEDEALWAHYAAAALTGYLTDPEAKEFAAPSSGGAAWVIRQADAMLAAHRKRWPRPAPATSKLEPVTGQDGSLHGFIERHPRTEAE